MEKAPKSIPEVVLEIQGTVAITNSVNLAQTLRHIDGRDDVHVTVLTGTGRFLQRCEELVQCGFVNKIFSSGAPEDSEGFLELVLGEVEDRLGAHLVPDSILRIKQLIRAPERDPYDSMGVKEVFSGIEVFMKGIPQEQFAAIASGKKRHKL